MRFQSEGSYLHVALRGGADTDNFRIVGTVSPRRTKRWTWGCQHIFPMHTSEACTQTETEGRKWVMSLSRCVEKGSRKRYLSKSRYRFFSAYHEHRHSGPNIFVMTHRCMIAENWYCWGRWQTGSGNSYAPVIAYASWRLIITLEDKLDIGSDYDTSMMIKTHSIEFNFSTKTRLPGEL